MMRVKQGVTTTHPRRKNRPDAADPRGFVRVA
jgi:hypothetical protein